MNTRAFVVVALLTVPGVLTAQKPPEVQSTPLQDPLLLELLSDAQVQDLDRLNPEISKSLALHLYAVPHAGTCVEETEWVCSYHYVLAVSDFGEERTRTAYDLGEVGEIAHIRWVRPDSTDQADTTDHAFVEFEARSVPGHAVRQNRRLKVLRRRYRLEVWVDHIALQPLR